MFALRCSLLRSSQPLHAELLTAIRSPSCTVATVLGALAAHPAVDEVVEPSLSRLIELDVDDAVTRAIASFPPAKDFGAVPSVAHTSFAMFSSLMATHTNNLAVRSYCARCIANLALLSSGREEGAHRTDADRAHPSAQLVDAGAVEQVVHLMRQHERLTQPKAFVWASLALNNLLMLDDAAPSRAIAAGVDEVLPDFIAGCLRRVGSDPVLAAMAIDNAVACVARLLSLQEPDNTKTSFRYQSVPFRTLEALAAVATEFADHPTIRHKVWEAFHLVLAEPKNLTLFAESWATIGESAAKRRPFARVLNPTLDFILPGSGKANSQDDAEFAALVRSTRSAVLGSLISLTAPRKELRSNPEGSAATIPTDSMDAVVAELHSGKVTAALLSLLHWKVQQCEAAAAGSDVNRVVLHCSELEQYLLLLAHLVEGDVAAMAKPALAAALEVLAMMARHMQRAVAGAPDQIIGAIDGVVAKLAAYVWNVLNDREGVQGFKDIEFDKQLRPVLTCVKAAKRKPSAEGADETPLFPKANGLAVSLDDKISSIVRSPVYVPTKGKQQRQAAQGTS